MKNKLLEEYVKEFEVDVELDDFNIKEVQQKLPAVKHKWVGRLMRHKQELHQLEARKDTVIDDVAEDLRKSDVIKITKPQAIEASKRHARVIEIANQIKDIKIVIEYLEKGERVLNSMSYDIKNIVTIMQLETL